MIEEWKAMLGRGKAMGWRFDRKRLSPNSTPREYQQYLRTISYRRVI